MVIAHDHEGVKSLVTFIDKHIAGATLRSVHVKHGPADRCTTARIVLHRSRGGFVRVRDAGDEKRVFDALEKEWSTLRAQVVGSKFAAESEAKPTIRMTIAIRLDDIYRAVAKTAFNVLTMRVGVALALSPEFDELREYVFRRNLRHPTRLEPRGIAVDGRFVRMVPFGEPPLVPTYEHAVTLFYDEGKMLAYVTLYKVHSFVVILGTVALPDAALATHEFSTVRQGNSIVEIEAIYGRLVRRNQGI